MKSLRHNILRPLFTFVLALALCISTPLSASAIYVDPNVAALTEEIIIVGSGEVTFSSANSNSVSPNAVNPLSHLAVRWTSTGDGFEISMQNVGNTAIEHINGSITIVETGKSANYSMPTLYPMQVHTVQVDLAMALCDENVVFTVTSIDSETPFAHSFDGFRTVPAYLISVWHPGGRLTSKANLNHHFQKHGKEVLSTNIVDYAQKAQAYHSTVLLDRSMDNPAQFLAKYKITVSADPTPGMKYKHIMSGQFIIIADSDSRILSYGL